jgi:hypothetical protein
VVLLQNGRLRGVLDSGRICSPATRSLVELVCEPVRRKQEPCNRTHGFVSSEFDAAALPGISFACRGTTRTSGKSGYLQPPLLGGHRPARDRLALESASSHICRQRAGKESRRCGSPLRQSVTLRVAQSSILKVSGSCVKLFRLVTSYRAKAPSMGGTGSFSTTSGQRMMPWSSNCRCS